MLAKLPLRALLPRSAPPSALRALSTAAAATDAELDVYDVVIVGSGMVGSALAALLGNQKLTRALRVAVLDQQPQSFEPKLPPVPELRVSTVTPASIACLRKAGAWTEVKRHATMFSHMQVWDSSGGGCICWDAQDLGHGHMGCVVENSVLQAALLSATRQAAPDTTSLMWPASVKALGLPGQPQLHSSPPAAAPSPSPSSAASASPSSFSPSPSSSQASATSSSSSQSAPSASHTSHTSHTSPPGSTAMPSLAWLQLQDGRRLHARLVVAADGSASQVRTLAGLRTSDHNYHQRALVATVRTSEPGDRTAWQRFLPSGPFALLPVRGGYHNIVWTTTPDAARELERLGPEEFAAAANRALHNPPSSTSSPSPADPLTAASTSLGRLLDGLGVPEPQRLLQGLVSEPQRLLQGLVPERQRPHAPPRVLAWEGSAPRSFPLHLKQAGRYVLPRLALVGDAAHAVHPLAGQGVNLGLGDAEALAQAIALACECGADIGDPLILKEHYEKPRQSANSSMITALDTIRSAFALQAAPLAAARNLGLSLINATGPVRNGIMRFAMGM